MVAISKEETIFMKREKVLNDAGSGWVKTVPMDQEQ